MLSIRPLCQFSMGQGEFIAGGISITTKTTGIFLLTFDHPVKKKADLKRMHLNLIPMVLKQKVEKYTNF